MFRLSRYLHSLQNNKNTAIKPKSVTIGSGPVVIWNLLRRCNLTCKHCYATSTDTFFKGELNTDKIFSVMDDLKSFGVSVLILSGGEPLMHKDIFKISAYAKKLGFYVGLSSNGTLINQNNINQIVNANYDYVGVSLDGLEKNHDKFRQQRGSFKNAINGIRLCQNANLKVGLRFTLTQNNAKDLPDLLKLMNDEGINKFYLSHLNYAGRGNKNRKDDAYFKITREAMDLLFSTCWNDVLNGEKREFVTGNNDADGVYLLHWVQKNIPKHFDKIKQMLLRWGGNASGVNISNIDNLGNVHPDTMWWDYTIGNVKERSFSDIWQDTTDPLMAGLKKQNRPLEGRCATCAYLKICNGNSRTRAWQLANNFWAEDPGCYLTDKEIQ